MKLILTRLKDHLLYGIKVYDDPDDPAVIWSIIERKIEKRGFVSLSKTRKCKVYLFNELALNVAWIDHQIITDFNLIHVLEKIIVEPADYNLFSNKARDIFEHIDDESSSKEDSILIDFTPTTSWIPIYNEYVTNQLNTSPINLFSTDEGRQQENLAIWLTDVLHPIGAYHSPKISKDNNYRELTDILLSHEHGSFIIESKTLSIFNRNSLPNRTKISKNVSSHVSKAINQLKGAIRKIKDGVTVMDNSGNEINVERLQPIHAIVLIPELHLIENQYSYGKELISDFLKTTNGFIHFLDISELLRVVQAANMISDRSMNTTPMMAFDYYLIERLNKSIESGTLCVQVLLRFKNE